MTLPISMTPLHYTCYGMRISSAIPCPELLPAADQSPADLLVEEGPTPDKLDNPQREAARFAIAPSELLLRVDNVASFWVRDGNRITVQKSSQGTWDDVRVFLYGTAFGAALLQQGRVPLHATTVTKDGVTVAFAGPCGAGKSTTAYTLIKRGWKLVADDVSVLNPVDGRLHVQPGYPSVKLWEDVLLETNVEPSSLQQIRAEIDKYRWLAKESFHPKSCPLDAIIGLQPADEETIQIEELKGSIKFKYLTSQTYRRQMIKGMADQTKIFLTWSRLLEQVKLWHVQRPKSPMNPSPLADVIEKLLA